MSRAKKTPGICRIDQPQKHNHGFYVRLNRNGKHCARFFSDRAHGTREKAFAAASRCYAEWDKKYPRMSRKKFAQIVRRPNGSGLFGVSKIAKDINGKVYEFWQASWSPRLGEIAKKSFSVRKYGDEKAKNLALKARKQGVSEMVD